jgi:VanZ family protein
MSPHKKENPEKTCSVSQVSSDPFKQLYLKGFFCYGIILTFVLLWPFDFGFLHKNNVKWARDGDGVIFYAGQIMSTTPCKSLLNKILSGEGLSIELSVASQNDNQSGPARIITYSADPMQRNFTVGQEKNGLVVRLRTINTDNNGLYPHIELPGVFASKEIQHIVITYDFKGLSIFVNGTLRLRQQAPFGSLDNWDPSYYLIFGNEATGNRPWVGRLYYAAIYNRPIAESEISQHYIKGGWFHKNKNQEDLIKETGLVARYFFNEGKGNRIQDSSGNSNLINLAIHRVIQSQSRSYLSLYFKNDTNDLEFWKDIFLNIAAFIPLGFFFHAFLRIRFSISFRISALILLMGGVFTISIESIQYFSASRHSSMLDVIDNLLGVFLGIALDRLYAGYLENWRRTLFRVTQ